MTRIVKRTTVDDDQNDRDHEIWSAIRYLDPDIERRKSDVIAGVAWIVILLLIVLLIYLLPH